MKLNIINLYYCIVEKSIWIHSNTCNNNNNIRTTTAEYRVKLVSANHLKETHSNEPRESQNKNQVMVQ